MNRRESSLSTVAPKPAPPPDLEMTATSTPGRMALRIADLTHSLGVSRRTLERQRSAGRFPPPDFSIGKAPLWKPETIRRWMDAGGRT